MEITFQTSRLNIHFHGPNGVMNIFYNAGLLTNRESVQTLIALCREEECQLRNEADKMISQYAPHAPEWVINDAWWMRSKASKWGLVEYQLMEYLTVFQ